MHSRPKVSPNSFLLVAALLPRLASATCAGSTYTYDGTGACASCAAGATFVSASAGCRPTVAPTDTAFFLSGSAAEGVSAFSTTIASPTYVAGPFGAASGAMALASGQYISAVGASAPTGMPAGGNVAWSASAWVKCAAPATWAGVIEWGAVGDLLGVASSSIAAIAVIGTKQTPTGYTVTTLINSGLNNPYGVAFDSSGNIFVADSGNNAIKKITPTGTVTSITNGVSTPIGIIFDPSGNMIFVNYGDNTLKMLTPGGTLTTIASNLNGPRYVALDKSGNYYLTQQSGPQVVRIAPNGVRFTMNPQTSCNNAYGIAVDAFGYAYVSVDCNLYKFSPQGVYLGSSGRSCGGAVFDSTGNLYLMYNMIQKFDFGGYHAASPASVPLITSLVSWPSASISYGGVAVDAAGSIVYVDQSNGVVYKAFLHSFLPACDSTWHHVAATYSPSSPPILSTYVDGALLSSLASTITLPAASLSTLRVGWSGDSSINSGSPFLGSLADLRVYNRTLGAAEVASLAQPTATAFLGSNLVPLSVPAAGASSVLFSCAAGTAGPLSVISRTNSGGSWSWASTPSCTPCAAGSFAPQGATVCLPCSPGTYSLATASACSLCPAGTFGDRAGLTTSSCTGTCATCPAGSTRPAAASSSVSCSTANSRAVPSSYGLQIWPAAHPSNPQLVDLVIAPLAQCAQLTSASACAAAASIVDSDGITRFVVGTAAAFHMEAGETLTCAAS